MISEKDITNVTEVIERSKLVYNSEADKQRLEKLKQEIQVVGSKYLEEVSNYDRV